MPTVKLHSSGKVILKGGKVSCACCGGPEPEECCMYPASALGDTYEVEDLPDKITVDFSVFSGEMERDGPEFKGGGFVIKVVDENWIFESDPFDENAPSFAIGSCLIAAINAGTVEDQFADEYEFASGGSNTPLFRDSLGQWSIVLEVEFDLYDLPFATPPGWSNESEFTTADIVILLDICPPDGVPKVTVTFPQFSFTSGVFLKTDGPKFAPEGDYENSITISEP
jgi:hypothetical protein